MMPHIFAEDSEESAGEGNASLSDWEREPPPADRLVFRDDNNQPIGFILHDSLNADQKRIIKKDIKKYGGVVYEGIDGERDADTLLIHSKCGPGLRSTLQMGYHAHGDPARSKIHVEFSQFVRRCIHKKQFRHRVPQVKPMGGIPAGKYRREFTEGDDEMLCWFLSRLIPEKEAGGRLGLAVYKQLLAIADAMPDEFPWGKRHTAESWKQRYKVKQQEFDEIIEEMVRKDPPREDQRWPLDRRVTNAAIKKHRLNYDSEESLEDRESLQNCNAVAQEEEEEESEVEIVKVLRKRRSSQQHSPAKFANKRQRMSQPSMRREQRPKAPRVSKGKEKAVEVEDDEQFDPQQSELNSLFDGDFDSNRPSDPEGSFRSPDRTLVTSSRSNQANASMTQATLVQATSQNEALMSVSRIHDRPRPSNRMPQSNNGSVWLSPLAQLSPPRMRQSSAHGPTLNKSQMQPSPSMQRPPSTYQPPKKAARRRFPPPAAIEEVSAPYRHTRQRLRSVEPPLQITQKSRKEKKQAMPMPEEPDKEMQVQPVRPTRASSRLHSVEPPEVPLPQTQRRARQRKAELIPEEPPNKNEPPSGEMLTEEMNVAKLLTQDPIRSLRNGASNRRGISMDTDDALIDRRLRAGSVSSQVGPPARFNFRPPSEILKRFQPPSYRRRSLLPPVNLPTAIHNLPRVSQLTYRKPRQSAPSRLRSDDIPIPQTPMRPEHDDDRASSAETFPPSGTRARLLMEQLTQREKTTPYRPLPGTRAAQFADGF